VTAARMLARQKHLKDQTAGAQKNRSLGSGQWFVKSGVSHGPKPNHEKYDQYIPPTL